MTQLRSGHSLLLATYRERIGLADSDTCQRCGLGDRDTLEHWLSECPANYRARVLAFGTGRVPLSVLSEDVRGLASYLGSLRLL